MLLKHSYICLWLIQSGEKVNQSLKMQSWGKLVKKIWKILLEVQPLIYYCMSNKQVVFFLSCLCLGEMWFREVAEQVVGTTKPGSSSVLFLITVFLAHQVPQLVGLPLLLYLRWTAVNRTTFFTDSGNQDRTKQKSNCFLSWNQN